MEERTAVEAMERMEEPKPWACRTERELSAARGNGIEHYEDLTEWGGMYREKGLFLIQEYAYTMYYRMFEVSRSKEEALRRAREYDDIDLAYLEWIGLDTEGILRVERGRAFDEVARREGLVPPEPPRETRRDFSQNVPQKEVRESLRAESARETETGEAKKRSFRWPWQRRTAAAR